MTIPSPDWVNALKLPTKITAGLFLAAVLMFILDYYEVLNLTVFGEHTRSGVLVGGVVFGSITLTSIIAMIVELVVHRRKLGALKERRAIRQVEVAARKEAHEAEVIGRIEYLSEDEVRYAADCLRKNEQSFLGYVYHGPISNLIAKGLVTTPGGAHNQDHYPYYFVDFAWKELLVRKENILARDEERRKREAEEKKRRPY